MAILFQNAWILTMDDDFRAIKNGWLLVEGRDIVDLGEGEYYGECD